MAFSKDAYWYKPGAMVQIVLAPCSPFSVTSDLMRSSAVLARKYGIHLHTHLAETQDEEAFCIEKTGFRPVELMGSLDWLGSDVWFAHSVHVNQAEIRRYADTGCGGTLPYIQHAIGIRIAPLMDMLHFG
jgi:cytosine/adenosine deaminase-related metal-dependent hydrolase